jgi:hypothetical protein
MVLLLFCTVIFTINHEDPQTPNQRERRQRNGLTESRHPEDLWHAFNSPRRFVRCTTVRKVVMNSTGSTSSNKKENDALIDIQKVDFDPDVLCSGVSGSVE